MSGYYHGQAGPYTWNYGPPYMAPEVPSRPLDPRQRQTHEGGEGRPPLQRKYHSEIEPYGLHASDDFEREQQLLGRRRLQDADMTSARRRPSPAKLGYENERPPLNRQYYSDHEAFGRPPVGSYENDQELYHPIPVPRHRPRKHVPSPPRAFGVSADHRLEENTPLYGASIPRDLYETKPEAPSPPPIPGAFDREQVSLPLRNNPAPRAADEFEYTEPSSEEEVQLLRKKKNGRRKPPLATTRRKEEPQEHSKIDVLEDDYPPQRSLPQAPYAPQVLSLQYRTSPPLPATLLSPIPETRPRKKKTTTKTGARRATISSVQIQQGKRSSASLEEVDDRHDSYYALPPPPVVPPPPVDRRRHSDIDVTLTSLDDSRDVLETTGRRSRDSLIPPNRAETRKRRSDRKKGPQGVIVVPGSFPSPEELRPEDSRSDIIPVGKRLAPADARSIVSGTTLRQSGSASASGSLGENVYRYKPLGALQFRLVRVLPRTMSRIKCELVPHSLEDPPDYIAISYAWGDTDDQKKIQLEGVDIPVSASLHGALFALRAKKESVLVWIDALSIDQQNREERTQQVQLMTDIYSNATSVAIWLGPEADNSNLAMQALIDIAARPDDTERIKKFIIPKTGKEKLSSVVSLFEREYWSRLWPVQEVFNAEEITVHCGTMTVPWPTFRVASRVFWNHKGLIDYHYPSTTDLGGPQASSSQFSYSQVLVYQGPSSIPDIDVFDGLGEESLLEVLRVCRRKLCSDPRDKLYGILGLLDEDIRNEFPVDYGLSVKEVYVRVFDYLLCTTEQLNVLCEAVHFPLHTGSNLPTWIPDWSHNPETTALGRGYDFSAAGPTKAVARVLDDRKRLEVSAIYIDTIQCHGIAVGTLCTLADYIMAFLHWRALLLSNVEDGESAERQEEFCRTLSLDKLPSEWEHRSWRVACYHVFAALAHERLPKLSLDRDLLRYAEKNIGIGTDDRRRFLQEHFGSRMMGRCFCITEEEHMGMGSGFMAAGDTVVIPLGCRTPVLLRPDGPRGEYRYVGDVYIDGYMHGEGVDEWKSGERELRKYVLH